MIVLVCGLPGTGKSTDAKLLAKPLKAKVLRTDEIRNELFEDADAEKIMAAQNPMKYNVEKAFDRLKSIPPKYQELIWQQKKMVYDELFKRMSAEVAAGRDVVLDGTFYKRETRQRVYDAAKAANADVCLVECTAPEKEVRRRITGRKVGAAGVESSNVDKMHIYEAVKAAYEPPAADGVPMVTHDTFAQTAKTCNAPASDARISKLRKIIRP